MTMSVRELRALLFAVADQDAPITAALTFETAGGAMVIKVEPAGPMQALEACLTKQRLGYRTAELLVADQHVVRFTADRYEIEGGPDFATAQECAEAIRSFEDDLAAEGDALADRFREKLAQLALQGLAAESWSNYVLVAPHLRSDSPLFPVYRELHAVDALLSYLRRCSKFSQGAGPL